ncbi:phosphopantothenoylcysteine synthetase/decarboxylase [Allocatelliglobosispora scoriae]|uniref:Phosphopantothenoylcysteine synthetase/decarboxylase n=1 Tax=Allocatelliglobosispora scoriae TaxID=643052 RepID=A0A841BEI7_9ACTN|nr:flavoprotein [Allocatelliglobosispora scoriae]MBB5866704.1 phosphopantothenoylcysteine synthetase/decarboxylase [Allocatelliglobosispora scoriae]
MSTTAPRLALVVCAAPPAAAIGDLARLLMDDGWVVDVVATDAAREWIDMDTLVSLTGSPVRVQARQPHEPKAPPPDAVALVPATFNTINLWASGVNNTAALGILNEALCAGTPIVAAPYVKEVLTRHPAFDRNLTILTQAGARLTETDALRPDVEGGPYRWRAVVELLREVKPPRP